MSIDVLSANPTTKLVCFTQGNELYIVVREHIDQASLEGYTNLTDNDLIFRNDRYAKYRVRDTLVTKITDFTEAERRKYSRKRLELIEETPESYANLAKKIPVQWVMNIINGQSEVENVLYRESDFLITKDLKFDGQAENLYLLVIFTDAILLSIRELTGDHISLLERVQQKVRDYCAEHYHLDAAQIKMYFHYHPSYWHLHLHVQHVNSHIGKSSVFNTVKLSDVLNCLRLKSDYYQQASLTIETTAPS